MTSALPRLHIRRPVFIGFTEISGMECWTVGGRKLPTFASLPASLPLSLVATLLLIVVVVVVVIIVVVVVVVVVVVTLMTVIGNTLSSPF